MWDMISEPEAHISSYIYFSFSFSFLSKGLESLEETLQFGYLSILRKKKPPLPQFFNSVCTGKITVSLKLILGAPYLTDM